MCVLRDEHFDREAGRKLAFPGIFANDFKPGRICRFSMIAFIHDFIVYVAVKCVSVICDDVKCRLYRFASVFIDRVNPAYLG